MKIFVSPAGRDDASGAMGTPVQTLPRARDIARTANGTENVDIVLSDGTYVLDAPLALKAIDGGQGRFLTRWIAAVGASPVISGGRTVKGWRQSSAGLGIFEAEVPKNVDSRQLWINGALAKRARIELPRSSLRFSEMGIEIGNAILPDLSSLSNGRMEVNGLGHFTDRWSPVEKIEGRMLMMRQAAWAHNNWGYDTLAKPMILEEGRLFLANALAFLTDPGEWFLDPAAGKLYVMPPDGVDIATAEIVLPHLDHLLSISGQYEQPVSDLAFEGLRFSHTSWMGPASASGYVNQQSGAFLTGPLDRRPKDALETCHWGCPEFETLRNDWSQIPAAVQVSAAQRITFRCNVFAHLGQIALGTGNNADAHASGIGLGTSMISVIGNVFTDLSGGAILAGGICRAAHHPEHKGQANAHLEIRSNRIHKVSQDFKDNAAILSTYVTGALILHNEISHAPYDAIDIGWGWGTNDGGTNPAYMTLNRQYYDHPENLIYDTPTTHRDVVVAFNKIHNVKRHFGDGGAIYNLSASPGTVIAENYLFDIHQRIGIYLDEGSRYITIRANVIKDAAPWLNINTDDPLHPKRVAIGNRATGNWHDTDMANGSWTLYQDNIIDNDHVIADDRWPEAAVEVMEHAGIEHGIDLPRYPLGD